MRIVPDRAALPVALVAATVGFTLLFTGVVFDFWAPFDGHGLGRVAPIVRANHGAVFTFGNVPGGKKSPCCQNAC